MSRSVEAQGLAALLNLDAHLEMGRIHAANERDAAAVAAAAAAASTLHEKAAGAAPVEPVPGAPPAVAPAPAATSRPTAASRPDAPDGAAGTASMDIYVC